VMVMGCDILASYLAVGFNPEYRWEGSRKWAAQQGAANSTGRTARASLSSTPLT